jgi:multidrug efflux pump subunit AcrA (membrane-fusion protein)
VAVGVGDKVLAGDVLATADPSNAEANVEVAKASLPVAEARLAVDKAGLTEAGLPGGFSGGGLGRGTGLTGTVEALTPDRLTITTDTGQTIQISLDADTGYHAKSDATSADVVVGSIVEVAVGIGSGFGQPNASPDPSAALGPATDVTVVE